MMEEKKYYSLKDFPTLNLDGARNQKVACPLCEKRHLSINIETGEYMCFTPGCEMHGRLKDFWEVSEHGSNRLNRSAGRQIDVNDDDDDNVNDNGRQQGEGIVVRMLPRDYKALGREELALPLVAGAGEAAPSAAREAVLRYLASIHIPVEVAVALGVGYQRKRFAIGKGGFAEERPCIAYVNYVEGRPVNVKFRAVEGEKSFLQTDKATKPLAPYNIDCLFNVSSTSVADLRMPPPVNDDDNNNDNVLSLPKGYLIVTEGEKDVMTLCAAGFWRSVSIPNGAASDVAKSFEAFEAWLQPVTKVIICGDSDQPGRTLQQHLCAYFGSKAHYCTLPDDCKDISEVLEKHGVAAVRQVVASARHVGLRNVVRLESLQDEVFACLRGIYDHGYSLGYGPLTDAVLRLPHAGGVITVTGEPNAGKTDFLDDLCAHLIFRQGKQVCLCSFEMPDKAMHTARYMSLALAESVIVGYDMADLLPFYRFLEAHLSHLVFADDEDQRPEHVLRAAEALAEERHIDVLVIDPYLYLDLRLEQGELSTTAIRRMLIMFQQWGRQHGTYVVVVAHPRKLSKLKGSNEREKIDMYSIADSAHWANISDYVLTIGRVREEGLDYTRLDVLKVRDQRLCHPGTVLYRRQPCGRYDERESVEALQAEAHGALLPVDGEVWGELVWGEKV